MPREDEDYLADMRSYAGRVLSFVEGLGFPEFARSGLRQYAVLKAVETIGEAASQVSASTRQTGPAIPWADIIGMRNRLVHTYYAVDLNIVWKTVQEDLPALVAQLEPLLPEQSA